MNGSLHDGHDAARLARRMPSEPSKPTVPEFRRISFPGSAGAHAEGDAPAGGAALRRRLGRAALMGLAGGLAGIAIGAAVEQFGPLVDVGMVVPPRALDAGHGAGRGAVAAPAARVAPVPAAAHSRLTVRPATAARIGFAGPSRAGGDRGLAASVRIA